MIAASLATVLLGLAVGEVAMSDEPIAPITFEEYLAKLQCDVTATFSTDSGGFDNRIGFQFASLSIGSEDGSDSTIAGNRARLGAVAELLEMYPEARVLIEGHVGVSAPPEIAQSYSEHRAHTVAQILEEEHHICPQRLLTRGWGSTIAEVAQRSSHPNADAAKQGYGWAEIFVVLTPCHTDLVFFFHYYRFFGQYRQCTLAHG